MGSYSPVRVGESIPLSWDFSSRVPTGDALVSGSCDLVVLSGTDATPDQNKKSNPYVTGNTLSQWFEPKVKDVVYQITWTGVTKSGVTLIETATVGVPNI